MGQELDVPDAWDQMYAEYESLGIDDNPSYIELVQTFANVLLAVDGNDVDGDSRMLLDDGQRFGFLYFGWGSCSGCDALQAAIDEGHAAVIALRDDLSVKTVWFDSAYDLAVYIVTKDWDLDFDSDREATEAFLARALEILASYSSAEIGDLVRALPAGDDYDDED